MPRKTARSGSQTPLGRSEIVESHPPSRISASSQFRKRLPSRQFRVHLGNSRFNLHAARRSLMKQLVKKLS